MFLNCFLIQFHTERIEIIQSDYSCWSKIANSSVFCDKEEQNNSVFMWKESKSAFKMICTYPDTHTQFLYIANLGLPVPIESNIGRCTSNSNNCVSMYVHIHC